MQPIVDFVAADQHGIIQKETWRATGYACPRCGTQQGNVWALTSDRALAQPDGTETRLFLCISCQHTAIGLNGIGVPFDKSRRAQEIISQAFAGETEE
jgi:hypothetical protein